MITLKRVLRWLRWKLCGANLLPEPDLARLNYVGARAGYSISNSALDWVDDREIQDTLLAMRYTNTAWAVVVTLTPQRHEQWWVHHLIAVFGPPVSAMSLSDGRRCYCTWEAQ